MVNIIITGDYSPRERLQEIVDTGKTKKLFTDVAPILSISDYNIINFENCIPAKSDKPILKTGPNLKTNKKAVEVLTEVGFHCATLANNHIRDYGDGGVLNVIDACNEYKLDYLGAGQNIIDAQRILYKTINDKNIAIVNFCENEYTIAEEKCAGAAPLNIIDNYRQITEAKSNSDFVIVIIHGGHEHYQLPSPRMQKTYRFFTEVGADVVVNHHQHCYSGYETYKGKYIFYGLGNFCFDSPTLSDSIWNEGYMLQLFLDNNSFDFKLHPYRQFDGEPTLKLMNDIELHKFYRQMYKLNNIISNEESLAIEFENYCEGNKKSRLFSFEPCKNRYIKALQRRGIIPSIMTDIYKRRMLNLFRCESHYDVTTYCLKDKKNENSNT